MQGNVVTAAKWLGGSIIIGSLIVALGLHWTVSIQMAQHAEAVRLRGSYAVQPDSGPVEPEATASGVESDARTEQLLLQTDEFRQNDGEWRRFWFNDQPSQMSPNRIHGAIGP